MIFISKTLVLGIAFLSLVSCTQNKKESAAQTENAVQAEVNLIGHKAIITYPDFKAEMTYISDSVLNWKTIDAQNKVQEGKEHFAYRTIGGNVFFLNWIEHDGTTVSQVIDYNKKKVYVYLSYSDTEKGRGGRNADLIEGSFELK